MAQFRSTSRSRDVGDPSVLDAVADALLRWDIHRAVGFRIITAPETAIPHATFVARVPWFPVTSRCEITEVFDEPGRRGFRYRTLPGHPLEGEETFLVEIAASRTVVTVAETSRPASALMRLPGARTIQGRINERYLEAAQALAASPPRTRAAH